MRSILSNVFFLALAASILQSSVSSSFSSSLVQVERRRKPIVAFVNRDKNRLSTTTALTVTGGDGPATIPRRNSVLAGLPNQLTYARLVSVPLLLLLSYFPRHFPLRAPASSLLFSLASFTDWLDGYLARKWHSTSAFGAFLDPVADKLMVSTALIVLTARYGPVLGIPSCIILARELGVSALREWMATRGKREAVKVGMAGKVKAAITMVSVTLLLMVPEGVTPAVPWIPKRFIGETVAGEGVARGVPGVLGPGILLLFVSAILTVTSGSVYFRAALPHLLEKEES